MFFAALGLLIVGLGLIIMGIVVIVLPEIGFKSYVFFIAGAICFIPGGKSLKIIIIIIQLLNQLRMLILIFIL